MVTVSPKGRRLFEIPDRLGIQFYSCFISYSTRDQDFGDCLYAGLRANGVRCGLPTEHLKIGERFRSWIDESVRLHDKLLLV